MTTKSVIVISLLLAIAGLGLTGWGAYTTARSVILTPDEAQKLAGTHWDYSPAVKANLLGQSAAATRGLYFIAAGSALQLIGVLIQGWFSLVG